MYIWIFSTHVFYLKCFHNCSLHDVASGVIVLLDIILFVATFCVVVREDGEPNKVEFVLIHIHGEFTETLYCYSMAKHTLPCFSYHIYLQHVFIYIHLSLIYLSIFYICTYRYFTQVFYLMFFHNCCLPGVASAIIAYHLTCHFSQSNCW